MGLFRLGLAACACHILLAAQLLTLTEASRGGPFPSWTFQHPNYKMSWNSEHPPIHVRLQETLENRANFDCIVIGILDNDEDDDGNRTSSNFGVIFDQLDGRYKGILSKLLSNYGEAASSDEKEEEDLKTHKKKMEDWQEISRVSRVGSDGNIRAQRLVICRIKGDPSKDAGKMGRELGSKLASRMKDDDKKWAFLLPPVDDTNSNKTTATLAGDFLSELTSALWADLYKDNRFKSTDVNKKAKSEKYEDKPLTLDIIWDHPVVLGPTELPFLSKGRKSIANGEALASGMFMAKDIVNAPHNVLNSLSLSDTAQRLAAESPRLSCRILNADDCERLGMGAYLGVARGSETPPQFIHLKYTCAHSKRGGPIRKLGIVGKGLLFDTGGYNIKLGMMELMKFDCGGAAAVLGAAKAIAKLAPEGVEVHFVVAACENMINDRAMVPGDILIASNGKTIEVINTDAEGRLTMADALVYADKTLGCDEIIELSTLTGACMVALGNRVAGLWSKNDALVQALQSASRAVGEKVWHMPLEEEYKDGLKSKFADLNNMGGKYGGAISAALFLHEFVSKDKPYAHIDMAGPVWAAKSGATGWGAKLVTEWVCASGRENIIEQAKAQRVLMITEKEKKKGFL